MRKMLRISFEGETYEIEVDCQPSQNSKISTMNLVKELKNKSRKDCKDFFSRYSGEPLSDGSLLSIEDGSGILKKTQYGQPYIHSSKCIEYGKIYKVTDLVFEVNELELTNCVFLGDIVIKTNNPNAQINLNLCFCFGHIRIDGCAEKTNVIVGGSLIDEIELSGLFKKIKLCQSSFGNLIFYNADVKSLFLDCCFTEKIRIGSDSKVNISFKEMFKVNMKKVFVFSEGLDEWEKYPVNVMDDRVLISVDKDTEITCVEEIAEFIDKNNICSTTDDRAQLLYMRNKIGLAGVPKYIYISIGGMIKPWIIVIWLLGITAFFGLLYLIPGALPCFSNEMPIYEKFFQAMYFSAITITSVGYGDLQPCGFAKFLAAIEGFVGLLIGGAFCVALTRKYLSH